MLQRCSQTEARWQSATGEERLQWSTGRRSRTSAWPELPSDVDRPTRRRDAALGFRRRGNRRALQKTAATLRQGAALRVVGQEQGLANADGRAPARNASSSLIWTYGHATSASGKRAASVKRTGSGGVTFLRTARLQGALFRKSPMFKVKHASTCPERGRSEASTMPTTSSHQCRLRPARQACRFHRRCVASACRF